MSKILLLSIRPKYAEKIYSGEKTVELRRTRPGVAPDDLVLIYTSSPRCALTGAFLVEGVESGTPAQMWKKFGPRAQISQEDYDLYYAGADTAFVIAIKRCWTFDRPVTLGELRRKMKGFHPPQVYRYLPGAAAAGLIAEGGSNDGLKPPSSDLRARRPRTA